MLGIKETISVQSKIIYSKLYSRANVNKYRTNRTKTYYNRVN